ncbi:hypothetical protein EG856_02335 [Mycoplasmopsis phocirhinis]|uniref:Type I restriction modification DNA specificity domain-containing protein n=1 Tax=Mycoplasmopsis phocirhinis TaxID=142650 RepID=A0A4P6MSS3_9BACT|nr:restriction endonuclease subunit S [Mycoplasmopsis phocirhinis]QBF34744.1 hypothetical protein EG856_02335 [Mycoplasmopsis phocirhinis]
MFTNAWELINISNVVEYGLTGGTPYTQNPEYYNGNIPFLNISDITENDGKYLTKIKKTISLKAVKNTSAKLIEQQHLIVGMYASIGKIAINKHNLAISQAVIALKFKKTYDLDFYYFLFYKKYINNEWNKESLNGVQSNLTKKTILDLPHKTTNIKEQNKISTLLNYFYKIVSLLQRKLKMLENIKNTLLEKMFV